MTIIKDTGKVRGFEGKFIYEILVTGPLCTSECAAESRLSVNLCKFALDVTAGVIVEATHNADILTIMQVRIFNKMLKAICMTTKRTVEKSKVIACHNCTLYNLNAERHVMISMDGRLADKLY